MINYPLATSTWDDQELQAIQSVIDKDIYTMGDYVAQFEQDFTKFINRKYCVMVSSGSAANLIATAGLFYTKNPMLKRGDEVRVKQDRAINVSIFKMDSSKGEIVL